MAQYYEVDHQQKYDKKIILSLLNGEPFGKVQCGNQWKCLAAVTPGLIVDGDVIGLPLPPSSYSSNPNPLRHLARQVRAKGSRQYSRVHVSCPPSNPDWPEAIAKLGKGVVCELGGQHGFVKEELVELWYLSAGDFINKQKFNAILPRPSSGKALGYLLVQLPSEYEGGTLTVIHKGKTTQFDHAAQSAFRAYYTAFYGDADVEISKVNKGHRLMLVYRLLHTGPGPAPFSNPPENPVQVMTQALKSWSKLAPIVYLLSEDYDTTIKKDFNFAHLNPKDQEISSLLKQLSSQSGDFAIFVGSLQPVDSNRYYDLDIDLTTFVDDKSRRMDDTVALKEINILGETVHMNAPRYGLIIWPIKSYMKYMMDRHSEQEYGLPKLLTVLEDGNSDVKEKKDQLPAGYGTIASSFKALLSCHGNKRPYTAASMYAAIVIATRLKDKNSLENIVQYIDVGHLASPEVIKAIQGIDKAGTEFETYYTFTLLPSLRKIFEKAYMSENGLPGVGPALEALSQIKKAGADGSVLLQRFEVAVLGDMYQWWLAKYSNVETNPSCRSSIEENAASDFVALYRYIIKNVPDTPEFIQLAMDVLKIEETNNRRLLVEIVTKLQEAPSLPSLPHLDQLVDRAIMFCDGDAAHEPANSELYHIIWASYVLEKPEDTIAKLFERLIAPVEVEDFKQLSAGLSMLKASFPDKIINNPGFLAIVSKAMEATDPGPVPTLLQAYTGLKCNSSCYCETCQKIDVFLKAGNVANNRSLILDKAGAQSRRRSHAIDVLEQLNNIAKMQISHKGRTTGYIIEWKSLGEFNGTIKTKNDTCMAQYHQKKSLYDALKSLITPVAPAPTPAPAPATGNTAAAAAATGEATPATSMTPPAVVGAEVAALLLAAADAASAIDTAKTASAPAPAAVAPTALPTAKPADPSSVESAVGNIRPADGSAESEPPAKRQALSNVENQPGASSSSSSMDGAKKEAPNASSGPQPMTKKMDVQGPSSSEQGEIIDLLD